MSGGSIALIVAAFLVGIVALRLLAKLFKYLLVGLIAALLVAVLVVHPHLGSVNNLLPKSLRGTATTVENLAHNGGDCVGALAPLAKTDLRKQPTGAQEQAANQKLNHACAPIRQTVTKGAQNGIDEITGKASGP